MPYNNIDATGAIISSAEPRRLSHFEIRDVLENALNSSGYTFTWIQNGALPYEGILVSGRTRIDLMIYIWNIVPGGRTVAPDEKRIEISTNVNSIGFGRLITPTQKTLLLGVYNSPLGRIFAAWDAPSNNVRGQSKSCQVSIQQLLAGYTNGIYQTSDSRNNTIYTFTEDYLGQYADLLLAGNNILPPAPPVVPAIPAPTTPAPAVPNTPPVPLSRRVQGATLQNRLTNVDNSIRRLSATPGLSQSEREAVVKVRIGQGPFKDALKLKYGCKCVLCNIDNEKLLIASHIKAWAACRTTAERIDPDNGLLLCPLHDALFDKHLISFDTSGAPMISASLSASDRASINTAALPSITITPTMEPYMAVHRSQLV